MKSVRHLLCVCIALLVALSGAYMVMGHKLFVPSMTPKTRVNVSTNLKALESIDTFYTGFFLIPLLDVHMGMLKRDSLKKMIGYEAQEKPLGVCKRTFEVAFGYENVGAILTDTTKMQNMCSNADNIPDPVIIDINAIETTEYGKYSGNCRSWDTSANIETLKSNIKNALTDAHAYSELQNRSKESLKSMIDILCK